MKIMFVIVPLFIAIVWGYLFYSIISGIRNVRRAKKGKASKRPVRYGSVGGFNNDHLHQMMHEDAMRAHRQAHFDAVRMNDIAHTTAMHAHDMGTHMHHMF